MKLEKCVPKRRTIKVPFFQINITNLGCACTSSYKIIMKKRLTPERYPDRSLSASSRIQSFLNPPVSCPFGFVSGTSPFRPASGSNSKVGATKGTAENFKWNVKV